MDRYSGPIGVPSQRVANSACSLLTAITFLGQRADITGPCSGVLDAGPDDGTPMFQSARGALDRSCCLQLCPPGKGPCNSPIGAP